MATFNKHSMPASESPEEYIPSLNFMNQIIRSSLRMGASFRRIIQSLLLILTLTSHNTMEKYGIFLIHTDLYLLPHFLRGPSTGRYMCSQHKFIYNTLGLVHIIHWGCPL